MKNKKSKAKTEKRSTVPAGLWVALTILLLSLLFYAACSLMAIRNQNSFTPPAYDLSAKEGRPELAPELGWGEIWQEGMEFKAGVCGLVVIENSEADIYFANLEGKALLKLRVLDAKGNILGETGIIQPGSYVRTVKFTALPEDGATIALKIMAYDPGDWSSLGSVKLNTSATVTGEE